LANRIFIMDKNTAIFKESMDKSGVGHITDNDVKAIIQADNGRSLLVCERNAEWKVEQIKRYDAKSGKQIGTELTLEKGFLNNGSMALIGPDKLLISITKGVFRFLQAIDLPSGKPVGPQMSFQEGNALTRFFSDSKEYFDSRFLGVFDHGRRAVTSGYFGDLKHCWISWSLETGQVRSGPVETPRSYLAIPVPTRNSIITCAGLGCLHELDIRTLSLTQIHELNVPDQYDDLGHPNVPNRQFESLAVSNDSTKVAIGTSAGTIHIFDLDNQKELSQIFVPNAFDYKENADFYLKPSAVTALSFFNNDKNLIASYPGKGQVIWDFITGKQLTQTTKGNGIYSTSFFVVENEKNAYEYNDYIISRKNNISPKPPKILNLSEYY
jgi:hypothetical protein